MTGMSWVMFVIGLALGLIIGIVVTIHELTKDGGIEK
jgi:uncharacterized membrane-anchored protein YhcB (DUF1043 family)